MWLADDEQVACVILSILQSEIKVFFSLYKLFGKKLDGSASVYACVCAQATESKRRLTGKPLSGAKTDIYCHLWGDGSIIAKHSHKSSGTHVLSSVTEHSSSLPALPFKNTSFGKWPWCFEFFSVTGLFSIWLTLSEN